MFSFDTILKKIGEIPVSVAKEETIKFLKIAYAEAENEIKDLKEKNAQLRQELTILSLELDLLRKEKEFEKINGLLWKPLPEEGYEPNPYCPKCQTVMTVFPLHSLKKELWNCSSCNFQSSFFFPKFP
jgi:hypothetical protein